MLRFPFVYFETNLQSKRRKANRWFSCFAAEETFETPRDDQFSSNFGLLTANHNNFWCFGFLFAVKTRFYGYDFILSLFFCWSTLVYLYPWTTAKICQKQCLLPKKNSERKKVSLWGVEEKRTQQLGRSALQPSRFWCSAVLLEHPYYHAVCCDLIPHTWGW